MLSVNLFIKPLDLVLNGSSKPVNNSNRQEYISKVFSYKLVTKSSTQYNSLVEGFNVIVRHEHINLFSPSELKTLLYGDNLSFEIADLQPYVRFTFTSFKRNFLKLKEFFWQVLEEFTPQERNNFLFFVTGSNRPPVGGFANLKPMIDINIGNGISKTHLPRAMTCVNTLYLSINYSKEDMREKIKKAISLNDGYSFA
jgi:hypothetical protein